MDRELSKSQKISRLIRSSETARTRLGGEVVAFRERIDFPARIRGSLKRHPTGWVLGSLVAGFAASQIFRRKPTVSTETKRRGVAFTLLGLALTAARPLAKVWLADQAKNYLAGRPTIFPAFLTGNRPPSQKPI